MAAEAVVSAVVAKLGDLLIQEARFLDGVTDEVEWLQGELQLMQGFLQDADRRQLADDRVGTWVRNVRNVAYDAEDAIEIFIYRVAAQRRSAAKRHVFFFSELFARHTLGQEIERIKRNLDHISKSRSIYGIENLNNAGEGTGSSNNILQRERKFYALLDEPDVIGLGKEMGMLVDRLIMGDSPLRVVSLVGIGGSGKTTLAKKVYNCDQVKIHFNFHSLAYVSQDCRLRELFYEIIRCFQKLSEDMDRMGEHQLAQFINDYLKDKKYFVVVDDIWRKEDWNLLKRAFPDENNGSRVMITTRNEEVAKQADPLSQPHQMSLLEETEAWNLFLRKVFVREDVARTCSSQLETIGKEIVQKCGGLPLAIVLLGGLLSTKEKTEREWLKVLRHITHHLSEGQTSCSQILALSYNDLPYYLKPCFLYLGVFPKDTDIDSVKLVRLWVAEGFVEDEGRVAEDIGESYLEQLISRNMIQVVKRRALNGKLISCRIHNLMQDFCISEAKKNNFFGIYGMGIDDIESLTRIRRLVNHVEGQFQIHVGPHLRSLLSWTNESIDSFKVKNLKLLKVLILEGVCLKKFPRKLAKLIRLRYLAVKTRDKLPASMSSLSNLQNLHVNCISSTYQVPNTLDFTKMNPLIGNVFRNMKQLKHLTLVNGRFGTLPLGHLSTLQTLSLTNCVGLVEGLQNLTNLRELHLEDCPDLRDMQFSFQNHHSLHYILLKGPQKLPDGPDEFPPNLTELTYQATKPEECIVPKLERLPNLLKLEIGLDSAGKEIVFSQGGFSRLRKLKMVGLAGLEEWKLEEGAIPTLQSLKIICCYKLKMLPEGLQQVTTLKKLKVETMPQDFNDRLRTSDGEDWHKINHIPSIIKC